MKTEITVGINLTSSEILDLRMALSTASSEWLDKYEQETDETNKATYLRILDRKHQIYEKLVTWYDTQKEIENNACS